MSALVFKTASRYIQNFVDESKFMKDHHEAMDCFNCQAFLQVGIDAYDWLVRADQVIRMAVLTEQMEYDPRTDQAIESYFRSWVNPCELANQWISRVQKQGFSPDNLVRFRECEEQVLAMIRFLDRDGMTGPMRQLRDAAVSEHEHGKTAEFV